MVCRVLDEGRPFQHNFGVSLINIESYQKQDLSRNHPRFMMVNCFFFFLPNQKIKESVAVQGSMRRNVIFFNSYKTKLKIVENMRLSQSTLILSFTKSSYINIIHTTSICKLFSIYSMNIFSGSNLINSCR